MADAKIIPLFKHVDLSDVPEEGEEPRLENGLIAVLTEEMEDSLWDVTNRIQHLWDCETRGEFKEQVEEIRSIVSRWTDAD